MQRIVCVTSVRFAVIVFPIHAPGSLTVAQALAEAHRAGERPPDALVNAYLTRADRDAAKLAELREKVMRFKSWFRTH